MALTVLAAGCARAPVFRAPEPDGGGGVIDEATDPAIEACLAAAPPSAEALLAELGGVEVVLAAVAPGAVTAVPDWGTASVPMVVTATPLTGQRVDVLLEGYPAGDPRIVADGVACAPRLYQEARVTVAAPDGAWSFAADGWVSALPSAWHVPGRTQVTLYGADALVDRSVATAIGLPSDATGELQVGTYAELADPAALQGWLYIGLAGRAGDTGVEGGASTRWRW
jgi:hypothetical protein